MERDLLHICKGTKRSSAPVDGKDTSEQDTIGRKRDKWTDCEGMQHRTKATGGWLSHKLVRSRTASMRGTHMLLNWITESRKQRIQTTDRVGKLTRVSRGVSRLLVFRFFQVFVFRAGNRADTRPPIRTRTAKDGDRPGK